MLFDDQMAVESYVRQALTLAPGLETRNGAMLAEHNEFIAESGDVAAHGRARRRSPLAAAMRTSCGTSARRTRRRPAGRARSSWRTSLEGRTAGRRRAWRTAAAARRDLRIDRQSLARPARASNATRSRRPSGLGRSSCSALLLPFQFVPGVIALRMKQIGARRESSGIADCGPRMHKRAPLVTGSPSALTVARRRVAITGIGMVSALGVGREQVWQNLVDGRCGIGDVTLFDTDGLSQPPGRRDRATTSRRVISRRSNSVAGRDVIRSPSWRRLRRSRTPASTPSRIEPAAHRRRCSAPGRAICCATRSTSPRFGRRASARATPSKIFNFFSNTPVDVVSTRFGLSGPRHCVVAACSSSTIAIGYAADAIRAGTIDTALAGGADVLCRLTFSGFNALRLVDTEPCRPFDAGRQGMTIGEAAAVLVLEDLDRARARGAQIYAELAGYGAACEAYHPDVARAGRARSSPRRFGRRSPTRACRPTPSITSTRTARARSHNDRAEARAFHRVFGDRAASVPVNAIKSMTGHCLGAAGAIEAAVLALTIARGVIPPTIHHRQSDPECALDVVPNEARECQRPLRPVDVARVRRQ